MSSNDLRSSLRSIRQNLCGMIGDTMLGWAVYWYIRADDRDTAQFVNATVQQQWKRGKWDERKVREL